MLFHLKLPSIKLVVHAQMYHPEVQEKVRKEIEDVIGDSDDINADQLNDLKYTENVIHESMRKYFSFGKKHDLSCLKNVVIKIINF